MTAKWSLLGCGCLRIHGPEWGHTCLIHDENGKRLEDYTIEEIVGPGTKIDIQTATTGWSCYCEKCDQQQDNIMPVGTRCIWWRTSYEDDEWECQCADSHREEFLNSMQIDYVAILKENGDS